MSQMQTPLAFNRLDDEIGLATAIHAKTGRDLFKGVTNPEDRKAAARIAIVVNKLEAEFGAAFTRIYGDVILERRKGTET